MLNETILLVDDEVKVLSSLSRSLIDENFSGIKTALNGKEALEISKQTSNLAVVVSDYHMPGMNGIDLLTQIRDFSSDTTRILLTGAAELEMAINAVNKGNVFRFLVKPCPPEVFVEAIKDGLRYNQLIIGERELLTKTLNGSIKVMVEILSIQSPQIFARSNRLRKLAHDLACELKIDEQLWEIELAALLCQIGSVTIPREILDKWQLGTPLNEAETDIIFSIPRIGRQLIKNIPRMEKVAEAVGYQNCTFTDRMTPNSPVGKAIPVTARILKVILDFDRLQEYTHSSESAFQIMQTRQPEYDPKILSSFFTKVLRLDKQLTGKLSRPKIAETQRLPEELIMGMVLSRDVVDQKGTLIVASGTVITEVLMYRLMNFSRSQAINGPIFIEAHS